MNQENRPAPEEKSQPIKESIEGKRYFPLDMDALLKPIPGENPAGKLLRYEGTYDQIQEAREEEADLPQGVWERELKKADWKKVMMLCVEALENRTKDIQICAWLLEALIHIYGFGGVKEGLNLLKGLCERFWEHLYPELEDIEARVAPFIWINEKLSFKLKFVNITDPETIDSRPYNWADWENANYLEQLAMKEKGILQKAESQGKVTRAKFLGSVMFTSRSFYERLNSDLLDSIGICKELVDFLDKILGKESPSLGQFLDTLQKIQSTVYEFLSEKKEEITNDLDESVQQEMEEQELDGEKEPKKRTIIIRSRAEAYRLLSEAADYLLVHEPHSPTPYLVKKAVSWGNMTLDELLQELISDEHELLRLYKFLGLKGSEK